MLRGKFGKLPFAQAVRPLGNGFTSETPDEGPHFGAAQDSCSFRPLMILCCSDQAHKGVGTFETSWADFNNMAIILK